MFREEIGQKLHRVAAKRSDVLVASCDGGYRGIRRRFRGRIRRLGFIIRLG